MQHDLLNQLLKITDEEELILQNRKEINKDIYTNQSNFIQSREYDYGSKTYTLCGFS